MWLALLPGMKKVKVLVIQLCPTLWDPIDCSPTGSFVHGIFQARILEWFAISFSRGSSWPRIQTWVSCIAGRFFIVWATREAVNGWPSLNPCSWHNEHQFSNFPISYNHLEMFEKSQCPRYITISKWFQCIAKFKDLCGPERNWSSGYKRIKNSISQDKWNWELTYFGWLSPHPWSSAFATNSSSRSKEAEEYLIEREIQIWKLKSGTVKSPSTIRRTNLMLG